MYLMPEEPELKLEPGLGLCTPRGEAESRGCPWGQELGMLSTPRLWSVALVEAAGRV